MINKWIILSLVLCLSLFTLGCSQKEKQTEETTQYDLPQIKKKGELTMLTRNSSLSFFRYRGEEMGFQYELAKAFAKSLGLKLNVKVANSNAEMLQMLENGEGDLIAYNFPVTKKYKDSINFCGVEVISHQVLVQRRNEGHEIDNVTELIGKDVYVKPGKHYDRLVNLDKELGGGINIHKVDNDSITEEDLIMKVSSGEIDYAISDDNLAQYNKTYYPNIKIDTPISFDQRSSWAVRKNTPLLEKAANEWNKQIFGTRFYKNLISRYFVQSKTFQQGSILSIKDGKISHFDNLFKKYSKEINWDWRLLAALAYTESNFDPEVVSWAGARGLMQLMPSTALKMGVMPGKENDPEESVKAAVKYIKITDKKFSNIKDDKERVKFILAAYNAGAGHVFDAMALAEKYGKNKYKWDNNVAEFILLKSNEEYYNDPVCKSGYFRGKETYNFVNNVLETSESYKKKIKV